MPDDPVLTADDRRFHAIRAQVEDPPLIQGVSNAEAWSGVKTFLVIAAFCLAAAGIAVACILIGGTVKP